MSARLFYDEGGITIWHGDNADVDVDPADVDLLLTDPPYGIDYEAGDKHINELHDGGVRNDAQPFDPTWLLAYQRLILWGANNFVSRLPESPHWIAWDKVTRNGLDLRISEMELAWTRNVLNRAMVFRHMWSGAFRDSERGTALHPTQKPTALMRWIVEKWTEPGDLVYDPYMGSGPIAEACRDLGRRYIGVELVEQYCQAAVNRLAQQVLL